MTCIVGLVNGSEVIIGGESKNGEDLYRWMVVDFISSVREALKDSGWIKTENSRDEGGVFLVGISGRLFRIDDDFHVGESADKYDSVGCGEDFARGSMFTTKNLGLGPNKRIELALESASHHSTSVRGPFTILSVGE